MAERRPVRILREDVARRIAAGEVIDRPAAILRELLDNAVDSGAKSINVEIADGGISLVKVSDDGSGMTRDDLENCANPHATSKIIDAEDLTRLSTLGFRGEALASIAAVSTLEISSGNMKMSMSNSKPRKIETAALFQDGKGTCVSSKDLFSDFPARRVFLKRPAPPRQLPAAWQPSFYCISFQPFLSADSACACEKHAQHCFILAYRSPLCQQLWLYWYFSVLLTNYQP